MKTLIRIVLIGAVSLVLGGIVNQLNPKGIPVPMLFKALSSSDSVEAIPADSAFVYLFQEKGQFVDLRPIEIYEQEHLPGAASFPFQHLFRQESPATEQGKTFILYAEKEDSLKVKLAAQLLQGKDEKILMLKNGFLGWLEYGFPTEGSLP